MTLQREGYKLRTDCGGRGGVCRGAGRHAEGSTDVYTLQVQASSIGLQNE